MFLFLDKSFSLNILMIFPRTESLGAILYQFVGVLGAGLKATHHAYCGLFPDAHALCSP